jgi:hypothetical protein
MLFTATHFARHPTARYPCPQHPNKQLQLAHPGIFSYGPKGDIMISWKWRNSNPEPQFGHPGWCNLRNRRTRHSLIQDRQMTFAFERGDARAQNRRSENSSLLGSPNSENVEPPLKGHRDAMQGPGEHLAGRRH